MENFKNSLLWYSIKRLLQGIPLIIIVVLFCFAVIQLAPGTPLSLLGGSDGITPEQEAYLTEKWGRNDSLFEQIVNYCKKMLTFGLGDNVMSVVALAGYSVPLFWIGQMLILIFANTLGWLPVSGLQDLRANHTGLALVWDVFKHLILPGSCLVFYYSAMILRVTRTKMSEVLQMDYIKTARAKGLPERRVIRGHALRNALAPVVTVIGMEMGSLVMGATVVESVFGYPGTGRLLFDAVTKRDYPLIAGMFFFISVTVILANILVDILYAIIDPQVRYN